MYHGMLRPSEAVSLMLDECKLPDQGWGLLEFSEIHSEAGREWTDDGEVHEARADRFPAAKRSVQRVLEPDVGGGELVDDGWVEVLAPEFGEPPSHDGLVVLD
jgi:hypothetical protein